MFTKTKESPRICPYPSCVASIVGLPRCAPKRSARPPRRRSVNNKATHVNTRIRLEPPAWEIRREHMRKRHNCSMRWRVDGSSLTITKVSLPIM
ncbi:hypothetical protein IEO21_09078 [Rhodonia placenta]|uniref:Uncharacterized protein n=1 Tax=Rhodonia placenta TaxID=104341 RepID=A0A8H7NV82_9APHY|nr:hypothetical protein IEO21_09078 [Postia placenta]